MKRMKKVLYLASLCLLGIVPTLPAQQIDAPQTQASLSTATIQELAQARALNEGLTTPPNFIKAFQLFQKAAQSGSVEAKAWLGSMYLRGRGTAKDVQRAETLIQEAAKTGDPVGLRFMGILNQNGFGVPQDYGLAKTYYEKAISAKDGNAAGRLGLMYLLGLGVQSDRSKAISLMKHGASLFSPM